MGRVTCVPVVRGEGEPHVEPSGVRGKVLEGGEGGREREGRREEGREKDACVDNGMI